MTSRRQLRSSASHRLEVPPIQLYSRRTGVPICRRQFVERPSIPHHICTVTHGRQTASQDFPLLWFLPGCPDMTYLSSLIIMIVFFWHFPWTLQ